MARTSETSEVSPAKKRMTATLVAYVMMMRSMISLRGEGVSSWNAVSVSVAFAGGLLVALEAAQCRPEVRQGRLDAPQLLGHLAHLRDLEDGRVLPCVVARHVALELGDALLQLAVEDCGGDHDAESRDAKADDRNPDLHDDLTRQGVGRAARQRTASRRRSAEFLHPARSCRP